jgi:hypothetical protein
LVKKDRGQSLIVKVRPGVFAIRESSMHKDKEAAATAAPSDNTEEVAATEKPERPPLPGSDVFPAEADDDDPILAGLEKEGEGDDERGGRRRRRRRRRGKGGVEGAENGPVNGNGAREGR